MLAEISERKRPHEEIASEFFENNPDFVIFRPCRAVQTGLCMQGVFTYLLEFQNAMLIKSAIDHERGRDVGHPEGVKTFIMAEDIGTIHALKTHNPQSIRYHTVRIIHMDGQEMSWKLEGKYQPYVTYQAYSLWGSPLYLDVTFDLQGYLSLCNEIEEVCSKEHEALLMKTKRKKFD